MQLFLKISIIQQLFLQMSIILQLFLQISIILFGNYSDQFYNSAIILTNFYNYAPIPVQFL